MKLVQELTDSMGDPMFGFKLSPSLHTTLERARTPWTSEPVRIGVMGDIGHGKSCLVAALLGDKDVIKEVSFTLTCKVLFADVHRATVAKALQELYSSTGTFRARKASIALR
jgi:translation initiation factor 2 gamma subunit (eIF-2gamma)